MIVRPLNQKDKTVFDKIFTESVEEYFPEYSERLRKHFGSAAYVDKSFNSPIRIGAFENEELIGYLLSDSQIGGVVQIHWLAVLRKYRGKGVGSALLKELEEMAVKEGAHNIQLYSDEVNLEFYKKNRYEILGFDKKGYYGTDNYLMKKLIQEPKEESFFK